MLAEDLGKTSGIRPPAGQSFCVFWNERSEYLAQRRAHVRSMGRRRGIDTGSYIARVHIFNLK